MLCEHFLKKKLVNYQQTYGCWVTLAHPLIPEILAPARFDWLAVDMEHTSISSQDALQMMQIISAHNITPLIIFLIS